MLVRLHRLEEKLRRAQQLVSSAAKRLEQVLNSKPAHKLARYALQVAQHRRTRMATAVVRHAINIPIGMHKNDTLLLERLGTCELDTVAEDVTLDSSLVTRQAQSGCTETAVKEIFRTRERRVALDGLHDQGSEVLPRCGGRRRLT